MSRQHLLPPTSTALEFAISESLDNLPVMAPAADAIRGFKYERPTLNVSFAPWIASELGLGLISQFFNTIEALIDAGVPWQRFRGTPAAIETALSWIEYEAITILDQYPNRSKWNRYQIAMGELPPAGEVAALMSAEYLAGISDPARSVFFRGFHGYDVRAAEWDQNAWDGAIYDDDSGVRLPGGAVKWSHGQSFTGSIMAGAEERQALGIDVSAGDDPTWWDAPWKAPGVSWSGITNIAAFKAFLLTRLPVLVGFFDAEGDPIGYRRPIAIRDITANQEPGGDAIVIEVRCRTDFGDGLGGVAATAALVFRARNADHARPGKLWLDPDEIEFEDGFDAEDMIIGAAPVAFTFRRTVRQHVTLTLEI